MKVRLASIACARCTCESIKRSSSEKRSQHITANQLLAASIDHAVKSLAYVAGQEYMHIKLVDFPRRRDKFR